MTETKKDIIENTEKLGILCSFSSSLSDKQKKPMDYSAKYWLNIWKKYYIIEAQKLESSYATFKDSKYFADLSTLHIKTHNIITSCSKKVDVKDPMYNDIVKVLEVLDSKPYKEIQGVVKEFIALQSPLKEKKKIIELLSLEVGKGVSTLQLSAIIQKYGDIPSAIRGLANEVEKLERSIIVLRTKVNTIFARSKEIQSKKIAI